MKYQYPFQSSVISFLFILWKLSLVVRSHFHSPLDEWLGLGKVDPVKKKYNKKKHIQIHCTVFIA